MKKHKESNGSTESTESNGSTGSTGSIESTEEWTHFGFDRINLKDKAARVNQVFSSVAAKYDLMNDVMSIGTHRLWKRTFVSMAQIQPGDKILDIASGSGDIAAKIAKSFPNYGELVVSDINPDMLKLAQENLINQGILDNVSFVEADAENLPFPNNHFNCALISFGLRNMADKSAALSCIYDKLKPGGQLLVMEFSQPINQSVAKLYDAYSFNFIPKMGKWLADDEQSYQYLVESIRMHPTQEELRRMFSAAGFVNCNYYNLSMGIVAIHKGTKP